MYVLRIAQWVLARLLRHPLTWLLAAIMAACWPAVVRFSPLGITTSAGGEASPLYEIAFIAALAGVVVGTALLQRSTWFLEPVRPLRRMGAEVGALAAAAAVFLAAALGPVLLIGGSAGALRWSEAPLGTLLALAHLCALALVLLRLPLPPAARLVGLPLLAWVLPALLSPTGTAGEWAAHVLDAGRHLRPGAEGLFGGWKADALPIIGMLWAALLLAREPAPAHEIRDPG